ncbi:MAG: bacteriohemerythrin, partial [Candidatus Adiutrix sp.]|nr:bacteriohemerythrin [Candidatus Adiutrix sp.]
MQWSDQFKIGIPKIDEQHKELFRQTEILLDRSKAGRIQETVQFLGDYVIHHFIDEQGMQAAVNYPKAEAHKKIHAAFAEKVNELKKRLAESSDDIKFELATEINRTVIGWLKEHIMGCDKDFAAYYRQHSQDKRTKRASAASSRALQAAGAKAGTWRADLATGIPKLDEQHQEIFRRADLLLDRAQAGQIQETLDFLAHYTSRHFGAEEKVQSELGYPGTQAHRKGHAGFTTRFQELKRRVAASGPASRTEAVKELHRYLVGWFREHIKGQDQPFAEFYKKRQRLPGKAAP